MTAGGSSRLRWPRRRRGIVTAIGPDRIDAPVPGDGGPVDARHEADVDPTMLGWGGPVSDATDTAVEDPVPGEPVYYYYYYGHGASIRDRSRHGETLAPSSNVPAPIVGYEFAGWVDSGDSGGPIVTSTGQAAGIITGCFQPCSSDDLARSTGTSLATAMDAFASDLGEDLRLVEGGGWDTVDNVETAAEETPDHLEHSV